MNTTTVSFPFNSEAYPYASAQRRSGLYVTESFDRATGFTIESREFVVGDGATLCGYSDREAYTVVARTAKTLTLQEDKATLLNGFDSGEADALKFTPGGFSGHTDGTQRYAYAANPEGRKVIARLTKKGWTVQTQRVIAGRHHHYDYNF